MDRALRSLPTQFALAIMRSGAKASTIHPDEHDDLATG
jgi:hypothetical protein